MADPAAGVDSIAAALEASTLLVIRQLADREELSITAGDALHRLDTEGPTRLTTLAALVGISQPSMTQLIQRLERRGIVYRTSDPVDRRVSLVAITDEGREMITRRGQSLRARLAEVLAALPSGDVAALELAANVIGPIMARLNGGEDSGHALQEVVA